LQKRLNHTGTKTSKEQPSRRCTRNSLCQKEKRRIKLTCEKAGGWGGGGGGSVDAASDGAGRERGWAKGTVEEEEEEE
jgi:hypothetical protein